jgi:hypothetical protein
MSPNYSVFEQINTERANWTSDILIEMQQREINWGENVFGCQIYELLGMSSPYIRHPPILAAQEQLALRGLITVKWEETFL